MDNEFKWIESIERGTASLNGIIDESRWMEAEIAKRKRTQRIVLIVLAVVFGVVALYVAFRLFNPRSSQVDRDFAMIDEAQAWSEARALFSELEPLSKAQAAIDGDDELDIPLDGQFDDPYAFTEVQRDRLLELEERLAECRPETEAKLRDYVLQHKAEFVFGTAQEMSEITGA